MGKYISIVCVACVISGFFFPFSFAFLPGVNTKMMLTVFAIPIYITKNIWGTEIVVTRGMLGTILIASVFSLWCFIAADINNTSDYSYASYVVSAIVWIAAGYAICHLMRVVHGYASLRLIVIYLAAISTFHCVFALIIDQVSAVEDLVGRIMFTAGDFMKESGRLYSIGVALDSGGVRFCIVLILIASLLTTDKGVKENKKLVRILIAEFFIISVFGSMISRTTSVGAGVALVLFLLSSGIHRLVIIRGNKILYGSLVSIALVGIIALSYLYNTDPYYEGMLRFAFEGFFNWVETGEWRTSSTDILQSVMWIWPETTHGWIVGNGIFGGFFYSTDIGYCRFVLYCGLIGLSIFSLYFVYNAGVFIHRYPEYKRLFLALLALTFIIWYKVATDIFQIYALLYCIDGLRSPQEDGLIDTEALSHEDMEVAEGNLIAAQ